MKTAILTLLLTSFSLTAFAAETKFALPAADQKIVECYGAAYTLIYERVYALKPGEGISIFRKYATELEIKDIYHRKAIESMWRNRLLLRIGEGPAYKVVRVNKVLDLFRTNFTSQVQQFSGSNMSSLGLEATYAPAMNKEIKAGLFDDIKALKECAGTFN